MMHPYGYDRPVPERESSSEYMSIKMHTRGYYSLIPIPKVDTVDKEKWVDLHSSQHLILPRPLPG